MLILYGFVALCTLARISADCGTAKTIANFDKSRHMGTWYLYGFSNNFDGVTCVTFNIFDGPSGEIHMNVSMSLPRWDIVDGQLSKRTYSADDERQERNFTRKIPDLILGTDYTSYSVLYDCSDEGDEFLELDIVTREPHPPQSVIEDALGIAAKYGYLSTDLLTRDKSCWIEDVSNQDKTTTTKPEKSESPPSIVESEKEKMKAPLQKKTKKKIHLEAKLQLRNSSAHL